MSLLLTDDEKEKFAAYCDQVAETSKGLIEQFEWQNEQLPDPVITALAKREKNNMVAFLIVAIDLRSRQSMSIGD